VPNDGKVIAAGVTVNTLVTSAGNVALPAVPPPWLAVITVVLLGAAGAETKCICGVTVATVILKPEPEPPTKPGAHERISPTT